MIQLWLGGKRIDSIFMLRQEFALHNDEVKIELCSELLRKVADGLFSQWLEYCSEARQRANEREREQDKAIGILLLDTFKNELLSVTTDSLESEKIRVALSGICGIEEKIIESAGKSTAFCISRGDIFSKLNNLSWYQNSPDIQRTLRGIATDNLITSTESLNMILERLSTHSRHMDLYLLNIDETPFTIRNLKYLRNIRIAGFGTPVVHFSARLRGEELDMKANNIMFEGFCLMLHGVELKNFAGRMRNIQ